MVENMLDELNSWQNYNRTECYEMDEDEADDLELIWIHSMKMKWQMTLTKVALTMSRPQQRVQCLYGCHWSTGQADINL